MTEKRLPSLSEVEKEGLPRLIDVAAAAGVSLTTASHSFSGKRYVSPATKEKIWRAAHELGYLHGTAPKNIAALLRPAESLRSSEFGTSSFPNLAGAMALAAMNKGFNVIIARDIADVAGSVARLDGCLLIFPNHKDEVLQQVLALGLATVSYDPDPGYPDFRWWAGSAYDESTIQLVEHLHLGGARRIAVIVGETDNMYRRATVSAYMQFIQAIKGTPLIRVAETERGRISAAETATTLLRLSNPPDAIVTTSSIFAAGVLDSAQSASIPVPEKLMIATLTDGPLAEFATVPITGLRIDAHKSAEAVLELLERRLAGDGEPKRNPRIGLQLIRRLSTQLTAGPLNLEADNSSDRTKSTRC